MHNFNISLFCTATGDYEMLGASLVSFMKNSAFFNKTVKNELLIYSQKQSFVLFLNKSDILN